MPAHKKPVAQHVLEGTYRPGRHAAKAGKFDTLDKAPPCPASVISKKAIAAWAIIIPKLTESGRIAAEDVPGLELAFRAYGLAHVILDEVQDLDAIQDTSKLRMLSSVANSYISQFVDIMARFGFSTKGREAILGTLAAVKDAKKPPVVEAMTR